jgi:hypothetical protein
MSNGYLVHDDTTAAFSKETLSELYLLEDRWKTFSLPDGLL